jgi:hypothetical protein
VKFGQQIQQGEVKFLLCTPNQEIEEIKQLLKTRLQKYREEPLINVVRNVGLYLHATVKD